MDAPSLPMAHAPLCLPTPPPSPTHLVLVCCHKVDGNGLPTPPPSPTHLVLVCRHKVDSNGATKGPAKHDHTAGVNVLTLRHAEEGQGKGQDVCGGGGTHTAHPSVDIERCDIAPLETIPLLRCNGMG